MLEGLRAVQNTWVGKAILTIIMGLIVVSFVVWGIGDIFRGIGSNEVARVGTVGISAVDYRQAYQTELQNLQQRARRSITNEEAHRFGLDGQVLSRMISDAVIDDRIQGLGLAISDTQMARAITGDPAFAGPGGTFDRARFAAVLREQGYSEQSFVREQRHVYLRQQVVQALVGDLAVPQAGIEALSRYQNETRAIDAVTLTPASIGPAPSPDEATVQGYFDAHKQDFDAPQYRKLIVLSLNPAGMAKPGEVADADARTLYEQVKDQRYGSPERRTLRQIVFPAEADAAAALAKIKAGASFADLAKERKLDAKDIDLGTVTKAEIFDKAVADAAFALPADATSEPVKGSFGAVLVHVDKIEPPALKPYAEVESALKQELALRTAQNAMRDLHDRIEDARTSGKSLGDAVKTVALETRTIEDVDAKGLDKAGKPVDGLADRDAVLRAAFSSDIGVDNDTVQSRDGSMTWFEVAAIDPARPKTLAEVRPEVEAAWTRQEIAKRLDDKAGELTKAVTGGQTMAQVAESLDLGPVKAIMDVRRGGGPGLPNAVVTRVFDVPVGGVGSAPSGSEDRLLFRVVSSTVPPLDTGSPQVTQIEDRYRTALSEDLLGAYLSKVGAEIGAKVNQEALRSASGASF